jgi:ABC-type transport system involved in multi-copper enzyme maturation permease subunit
VSGDPIRAARSMSKNTMRAIWLIAKTVLIESVRRKEIYIIVLAASSMIGMVMTLDFFSLEGLVKFYREIALKVTSVATALTVLVLATRQLPREFERRTIYPLLAKPVSRLQFLAGKLLGVMMAAFLCLFLFMAVYVLGALYLGSEVPYGIFLQYVYLQGIMMLILATLGFWLSMILNIDAAISLGVLFFATAATFTSIITFIYEIVGRAQQVLLLCILYGLPQLTLFDLSAKAVHAGVWNPLSARILAELTAYGLVYAALYFTLATLSFRRKPL